MFANRSLCHHEYPLSFFCFLPDWQVVPGIRAENQRRSRPHDRRSDDHPIKTVGESAGSETEMGVATTLRGGHGDPDQHDSDRKKPNAPHRVSEG